MTQLVKRVLLKLLRLVAQRLYTTPLRIPQGYRCVSFCFDDFPQSAATEGADILEKHGVKGTFYVCMGRLGQESPVGPIATLDQVRDLHRRGHEIGCHTCDHGICALMPAQGVADTCERNVQAARQHGLTFEHFAYPQGEAGPTAKNVIRTRYKTARTVLRGINQGCCDAHFLRGMPLNEKERDKTFDLIDKLDKEGGWLQFVSHDVSAAPLPYGINRDFMEELVERIKSKGIDIIPVGQVYSKLLGPSMAESSFKSVV